MKKSKVLAIAASAQTVDSLCAGAAYLGEETCLVYLGSELAEAKADKVVAFNVSETSLPSVMPEIVKFINDENPDAVITDGSVNGRYAAAFVAVSFRTAAVTDAATVEITDDGIVTTRLVYGGKGIKTELNTGKAVICVTGTTFDAENDKPCTACTCITAAADERVVLLSHSDKEVKNIDITSAKRIIGVGRGLKEEENLAYINELAKLMDAEIACTRPVSEEMKWYPRQLYIGVSGITIKPDVYVAVGISGQVQHMIGTTGSGTIIAINRDKDAPIFSQCDIGIVGDAVEVLKALCAGLQK